MAEKLGNNIENSENKYEEFLELLKTNPEAIESQVVKNQCKNLLYDLLENAKDGIGSIDKIIEILKLNIIDKNEIKNKIKELLDTAIVKAKEDSSWGVKVASLLTLEIIDKNEVESEFKELLDIALTQAITFSLHREGCYTPPNCIELLKLNIVNKSEIKDKVKTLLNKMHDNLLKNRSIGCRRSQYPINDEIELLKLNILDKKEIEGKCKELFDIVFRKTVQGELPIKFMIELLKLNILDKKEIEGKCKELFDIVFRKTVQGELSIEFIIELLKLNILDKKEIEGKCKELLTISFIKAQTEDERAIVVSELLKLEFVDKNTIQDNIKELLDYIVLKLKDSLIKDEFSYNKIKLKLIALIGLLGIIDNKEINDEYKDVFRILFTKIVDRGILNLGRIPRIPIKKVLPKIISRKLNWTDAISELLKFDIFDKNEITNQGKILVNFINNKSKFENLYEQEQIIKLLRLEIVDKNDVKNKYKELLCTLYEDCDLGDDGNLDILLQSLSLNILEDSEIEIEIPNNVTLYCAVFLENNKSKIKEQDIKFIENSGEFFTQDEMNYLYKNDYKVFVSIENAVIENDYQEIWKIKKECYPLVEKTKQERLEAYFGEGIWTFFVDKVPGNKILKNRFRDPHNALLHVDDIIVLAKQLEEKGVSKEYFLKNYLGIAGDRNNGYQQLNDFLIKYYYKNCNDENGDEYYEEYDEEYDEGYDEGYDEYDNEYNYSNDNNISWQDMVKQAMKLSELKDNNEFMKLANMILEKDKTGELYKNLDELEQIITVLQMLRNKESLIKLQKLADSEDPKDKILYEYYKSAIYHPRTKPIIMKMYDNPGEFLGLDDTTFPALNKIHQAKKPSNMVENFEYLDFDARDLVNCLPLGVYDKLSYFKQKEMKFYMTGNEVYSQDEIKEEIREFLKSVGESDIPRIMRRLRKDGDNITWYQIWTDDNENKDKFINKLTEKYDLIDLINLFKGLGFSKFNKYKDLRLMTAKISSKSDPNNWFNGFNCDSLAEGHGKKVVAMFNPYCTDFCIYEGEQDPKEDNLKVTSWVTLNRAIPENFKTLLEKAKSETTHDIANVLGDKFEDYKDPNEYVITMDNIEANPNFEKKYSVAIRKIYEKFFSEYVRENPMSPNEIPINTHKFYSGVNYNKIDILDKQVPNESLPVFVNAYSDNSESYSLQGKLDAGEQKEKEKKEGIYPLSIEDVVQISYMEGKIYPASMKDHLGNLQHEITASILNNTLKGRDNLSFAWYNKEGKIGGYILAYQGKMEDGTPGIYISDFAMDKKYRGPAGIKMIHHWMKVVKEKEEYADMPVFTRARENTSYRMIKIYAKRQGYKIVKDETVEDGGENFHRVVMKSKR